MDKVKDLLQNSLKYYDTNKEKYEKLFNKANYYKLIKTQNNLEHNQIILFDKNKKEIYRTKYEYLGSYYKKIKLWVWGWTMAIDKKYDSITSRKLLNYAFDLDKEFDFLKLELMTSRFRVSSEFQLDIHAAIASYISKKPIIFKIVIPDEYDDVDDFFPLYTTIDMDTIQVNYLYFLNENI